MTAVFGFPVIVCVNCCVCAAVRDAVPGATSTIKVFKVTVAVAVFVLSADEVAVTVTGIVANTAEGAVYSPLPSIVPQAAPPAAQSTDQVTDVSRFPVTVFENCCVCEAVREAVPGDTEIVNGFNVTVAVAVFVLSTEEVAVTVTVVVVTTTTGAL